MKAKPTTSRRQRLRELVESGQLRYTLRINSTPDDVTELAVEVLSRYCAPRRRRVHSQVAGRPSARVRV